MASDSLPSRTPTPPYGLPGINRVSPSIRLGVTAGGVLLGAGSLGITTRGVLLGVTIGARGLILGTGGLGVTAGYLGLLGFLKEIH